MKSLSIVVLVFLLAGCSKDEEVGFTSLIGSWRYETPDEKIKVEFDIVGGNTDILEVKNPKIVVDGVEGMAVALAEGITETTMSKLRINANDVALTYPFDIVFTNLSASADFKVIEVETAVYRWPWSPTSGPTSNSLTDIQIVRK